MVRWPGVCSTLAYTRSELDHRFGLPSVVWPLSRNKVTDHDTTAFGGLIAAATVWGIWGTDMFPAESGEGQQAARGPAGEQETQEEGGDAQQREKKKRQRTTVMDRDREQKKACGSF